MEQKRQIKEKYNDWKIRSFFMKHLKEDLLFDRLSDQEYKTDLIDFFKTHCIPSVANIEKKYPSLVFIGLDFAPRFFSKSSNWDHFIFRLKEISNNGSKFGGFDIVIYYDPHETFEVYDLGITTSGTAERKIKDNCYFEDKDNIVLSLEKSFDQIYKMPK